MNSIQALSTELWSPNRDSKIAYLKRRHKADNYTRRPDIRDRIFYRDNNRCVLCGSVGDLTIDHIKSIYQGGSNNDDNLRTLCRRCNSGLAP